MSIQSNEEVEEEDEEEGLSLEEISSLEEDPSSEDVFSSAVLGEHDAKRMVGKRRDKRKGFAFIPVFLTRGF